MPAAFSIFSDIQTAAAHQVQDGEEGQIEQDQTDHACQRRRGQFFIIAEDEPQTNGDQRTGSTKAPQPASQ